jgi:hypothetical protein
MARPRKEGMDYFPHDTNAAADKKIDGNDGYVFYFILLEMIYQETTFELDISDAETIQILCKKIGINEDLFGQILHTAIKRDCFDKEAFYEREVLTSNGIKKRASVVIDKREKMRKVYETIEKKVSASEIEEETQEEKPQSKVKESKVKEKKKDFADFVTMTEAQFTKLVDQYGPVLTNEMVSVLDNYKGSKGKTYKDDYRAILSWVVAKVIDKNKPIGTQAKNDLAMQLIKEAEERERIGNIETVFGDPEYV